MQLLLQMDGSAPSHDVLQAKIAALEENINCVVLGKASVVRMCLVDHALWCVGSICHMFGKRPFTRLTADHSGNQFLVAFFAFGEGLQNNHHAFPNSAIHGFKWYEPDISALFIRLLRSVGLIWKVRVATPEVQQRALADGRGIVFVGLSNEEAAQVAENPLQRTA